MISVPCDGAGFKVRFVVEEKGLEVGEAALTEGLLRSRAMRKMAPARRKTPTDMGSTMRAFG